MRRIHGTLAIVFGVIALPFWYWAMKYHESSGNLWWALPPLYTLMATIFTGCACLGWVLYDRSVHRGDGETRCRKCKYILRGLSEPRCPECGEPI